MGAVFTVGNNLNKQTAYKPEPFGHSSDAHSATSRHHALRIAEHPASRIDSNSPCKDLYASSKSIGAPLYPSNAAPRSTAGTKRRNRRDPGS